MIVGRNILAVVIFIFRRIPDRFHLVHDSAVTCMQEEVWVISFDKHELIRSNITLCVFCQVGPRTCTHADFSHLPTQVYRTSTPCTHADFSHHL